MPFSVGIGIITYNRKAILSDTIDRVRAYTSQPGAAIVVADDGSSDGTGAMLREKQVPVITGVNMGIAWNKNRALFLLAQMLGCETVILLEDDTQPNRAGWEGAWLRAAGQWGHMNLAGDWMKEYFLSGAGSAEDPVRSDMVTAQCSAYSWNALTFGGYFDSRYKGYGHEHVDHTARLIRVGYGGTDDGQHIRFFLMKGDLGVVDCQSHYDQAQIDANHRIASQSMGEPHYRMPWRDHVELRQFRSEIESAMGDGHERFRLTSDQPGSHAIRTARPGLFRRLFGRG
jgi:glycosyltransferase involved in cell wall biosynthesis